MLLICRCWSMRGEKNCLLFQSESHFLSRSQKTSDSLEKPKSAHSQPCRFVGALGECCYFISKFQVSRNQKNKFSSLQLSTVGQCCFLSLTQLSIIVSNVFFYSTVQKQKTPQRSLNYGGSTHYSYAERSNNILIYIIHILYCTRHLLLFFITPGDTNKC